MPAKLPKFSYPVPSNKNGQAFSSAKDLLSKLGGESSGHYLVGNQGMWHGGIHITDATIPWCALSTDSEAEKAYYNGVPYKGEQFIRCMADGEIVAFRVCKDYESEAIEWRDEKLQLSSSFVLVKHYAQPADKDNSGLTFYTLYMNLAPFAAYGKPGGELDRKTARSQRYYASADDTQSGSDSAKGSLTKDTRVTLGDNIITRASDLRQFTEVTLTAETKNAAGATLAAGTKIWTVSDQGSLKAASQSVPVPPWWAKCTPAYGTQRARGVNCTSRTDWSFYLSREDVLQSKAAGKLAAGFPLTYEPGNAAQQVIRPGKRATDAARTFSLCTLGRDVGKLKKGDRVWVVSGTQPAFGGVVTPVPPIGISAGDSIGHMGFYQLPEEHGKRSRYQVHIECLSMDDTLPTFLTNPEHVGADSPAFLKYPEGAVLYAKNAEGVMAATQRKTRSPGILTLSGVPVLKTGEEVTHYQIYPEVGWLAAADIQKVSPYSLGELGFVTLDKAPESFDLIDGIKHPDNVVKGILEQMYKVAQDETRTSHSLNKYNYKRLLDRIDRNQDGYYSEKEYLDAIHNESYRDALYRIIVKHGSEWYYGKEDPLWKTYLDTLTKDAPLWKTYTETFLDKMTWMKKVPGMGPEPWHMHPVVFLDALKTEDDCAKLIWGEIVNQRLGSDKACEFRKKVVKICAELWGEEKKNEYANSLMACMAVETSRLFTSSVVKLMPKVNSKGEVLLNSKGKPIREYRPITKQELTANPSIASQNAVGLIQFTGPAVTQLNRTHGLSVTKQDLALMDEIEQLDYVKLYFSSNKSLFNKIESSDDIYLYIFCPTGVGRNNDFALYSRQKDKDEGVNYYSANSSLDSNKHGNNGNNDGIIQRGELLTRLNKLRDEGQKHINKCLCNPNSVDISKEPSGGAWVNRFPTSASLEDLLPAFSSSVRNFIQSIKNAGGNVRVSATYRPVERAYLMHYSWRIAREGMVPEDVPAKQGVNIDWTHKGNHASAVAAAQDMVSGYQIVYKPVLTSRHTQKRAIDMTITNIIGKLLKDASGNEVLIQSPSSLHSVGVTYGVYKLLSDPPHWSDDGH